MHKKKNLAFSILLGFLVTCTLPAGTGTDTLEDLLANYRLLEAEKYLENGAGKLKRKTLEEGWGRLGDAYSNNCQYIKALAAYLKSTSPRRNSRDQHNLAGLEHLALGAYGKAKEHFYRVGNLDLLNRVRQIEKGDRYLAGKNYDKALEVYRESGRLEALARYYSRRGDEFRDSGDTEKAKDFYKKALREYENMLKSFDYWWSDGCNKGRLRCLLALAGLPKSEKERKEQEKLQTILQGVGLYCSKLREESIYFYCREKVREAIDYSILGNHLQLDFGSSTTGFRNPGGRHNYKYTYDYQLLQDKGDIKESRKLLWSNDKRKIKRDEWQTRSIVFKKIIFGPIGIFGAHWQPHFHYKITGQTTFKGEKAVILEAIPRFPLKFNPRAGKVLSFGKAWIKADDFTVLKIEWMPKSLGNNLNMRKIARAIQERPALSFTTEFMRERGGIRYPSRSYYQEYFLDNKGRKSTFVSMDISYEKFKFFNVDAEVIKEE